MQEPKRKTVRLPACGYGAGAWYFITVCTKDRARILGQIVGAADQPPVQCGGSGRIPRAAYWPPLRPAVTGQPHPKVLLFIDSDSKVVH